MSLSKTRRQHGIPVINVAKRNLLQRISRRSIGAVPRIQKRWPSMLIRGNTKRVVNVDKISPTTPRFMNPMAVIQPVN